MIVRIIDTPSATEVFTLRAPIAFNDTEALTKVYNKCCVECMRDGRARQKSLTVDMRGYRGEPVPPILKRWILHARHLSVRVNLLTLWCTQLAPLIQRSIEKTRNCVTSAEHQH